MSSTFITHYTRSLERALVFDHLRPRGLVIREQGGGKKRDEDRETNEEKGDLKTQQLHALLVYLSSSSSCSRSESESEAGSHDDDDDGGDVGNREKEVLDVVRAMKSIFGDDHGDANETRDRYSAFSVLTPTQSAYTHALLAHIVVALYTRVLDVLLSQAEEAECEGEWWSEEVLPLPLHLSSGGELDGDDGGEEQQQMEKRRMGMRIGIRVVMYFVQTLPLRLSRVFRGIRNGIQQQQEQQEMRLGLGLGLGRVMSLMFPHLKYQSQSQYRRTALVSSTTSETDKKVLAGLGISVGELRKRKMGTFTGIFTRMHERIGIPLRFVFTLLVLPVHFIVRPLNLTRDEVMWKRKALLEMRDKKARGLGEMVLMRREMEQGIKGGGVGSSAEKGEQWTRVVEQIRRIVVQNDQARVESELSASSNILDSLSNLSLDLLSLSSSQTHTLTAHDLARPSAITRLWPKLLLSVPLLVYVYTNQTAWAARVRELIAEGRETVRGLVEGWLLEPLSGVVRTVRAGTAVREGALLSEEGRRGDLESLERMTLSLASDVLSYTPSQLTVLAEQVKHGDLTPVMQIYESDLASPFLGLASGRLVRSVGVVVQKAKVDLDQAIAGIDHLLKSQELTFALVGMSPALGLVYVLGVTLWGLGSGTARFGWGRWVGWRRREETSGRRARGRVWVLVRKIERLLILQISSFSPSTTLNTGHLILLLSQLRSYAIHHLPEDDLPNGGSRAALLVDVRDLADERIRLEEKLSVVRRVWRVLEKSGKGAGRGFRY